MSNETEIKLEKIVLTVGKEEWTLSVKEAKELKKVLEDLFEKETQFTTLPYASWRSDRGYEYKSPYRNICLGAGAGI